MKPVLKRIFPSVMLLLSIPVNVMASTEATGHPIDLTGSIFGILALVAFIVAYGFVLSEEFLHLRKSKPVIVAAGVIWALVGVAYYLHGDTSETVANAVRENVEEFGELLLFLLSAMTFINTMDERNVFNALRAWLVNRGFTLKAVFWITGLLAFFISPFADNLTTALLMGAVVMSVGRSDNKFVALACINIVVAANAGGAYSPFGDITTLMVWQAQKAEFFEFFDLFIPSLFNWFVPALLMSFAIAKGKPTGAREEVKVSHGGFVVIGLFMITVALAVTGHSILNMPPFLGMMTGLGILKIYGYYLRKHDMKNFEYTGPESLGVDKDLVEKYYKPRHRPFDIFISMKRAEWDTLMFFYGVVLSVGGLGIIGYLTLVSNVMYHDLGATEANVLVGLLSSIVDNIPVMFAVLKMDPDMGYHQWLLVTLTAGVGGSLLSIGSAAGVALMGQARGVYTFFSHLKWTWAIALGYIASIAMHLYMSDHLFK